MRVLIPALLMLAAAHAQAACPPSPNPVTLNCTTATCRAEACWATPEASLTGCNLYITTPTGALPPISGSMTTPGTICTVPMPKLVTGTHSLTARGVNGFGEGPALPTPLSLQTGQPPAAPSDLAIR